MAGSPRSDKPIGDFGNNAEIVTKSDTVDFDGPCTVVAYNGTNIKVRTANGQDVTIPVIVGVPLPVKVIRVFVTGTDATTVVAYW